MTPLPYKDGIGRALRGSYAATEAITRILANTPSPHRLRRSQGKTHLVQLPYAAVGLLVRHYPRARMAMKASTPTVTSTGVFELRRRDSYQTK
jgi:hypothetical protein